MKDTANFTGGKALAFLKFIRLVIKKFLADRCLISAQALTYMTMFSLIPVLAIGLAIVKLFGGFSQIEDLIYQYISEILNPGALERVSSVIKDLTIKAQNAPLGSASMIVLAIMAFFFLTELEDILNFIWRTEERRPLFTRIVIYWTGFTLGPLLIAVPLLVMVYFIHFWMSKGLVYSTALKVIPYVSMFILLWGIFYYLPAIRVRPGAAALGALVGDILWQAAAWGYALYTAKVVTYSKLYGSLSVIPLFMLWLFVSWAVILFGAEVAYVFQYRRRLFYAEGLKEEPDSLELCALLVGVSAAEPFVLGRPGPTVAEIVEAYGLPVALVEKVVSRLIRAGFLIKEATEERLLPACDPEKIRIKDLLAAVTALPNFEALPPPEGQRTAQVLSLWQKMRENPWGEMRLKDLVHRITQAKGDDHEKESKDLPV